jgi:hypothetical protein
MRGIQFVLAVSFLFLMQSFAIAGTDDGALLRFIRHFEAKGSYDIYHTKIKQPPPKRLTEMTVGEVMAWQASLRNPVSTAAGGYQIIKGTLKDIVNRHNIPKSAIFNEALQDRMARHLIDDCSGARARSTTAFANCLAGIWAALPLVSGPKKGKSAYHKIAGNKALTTPENFMAVLTGLPFRTPTIRTAQANIATGHKIAAPRYVQIKSAMKKTAQAGNSAVTKQTWATDPYALD